MSMIYDATGEPIPDRKPRCGFGMHLYDSSGRMHEEAPIAGGSGQGLEPGTRKAPLVF